MTLISPETRQEAPDLTVARLSLRDEREKRSAALGSMGAAVFLTTIKLVAGFATGSLGILSEAAHSGLDLVAAVATWLAVRASSRPPDQRHTYGHGKIENLSALVETALLLVTCLWIIAEAVERLFLKHVVVEVSVWSFAIMLVSIVVDLTRSRALARAALRFNSPALEADALHFSTDVWSSTVVIMGLVGVVLASRPGLGWLLNADAVAALGVALIVVWISIRLGRKTVADLMDEVPPGMREEVARAARVSGVAGVDRVRVRRAGPNAFVDLAITVDRTSSIEDAHAIASAAEAAVRRRFPAADVVVHVEPSPDAAYHEP
jgi:cation diffusion facilitator family transporter